MADTTVLPEIIPDLLNSEAGNPPLKHDIASPRGLSPENGGKAQNILSGLNPRQREVAVHGEGPLLVLAVAGSGKTRAIAHRAAYLVSYRNVPPSQILCLTFTNKAAGEMRERIRRMSGDRLLGMTITTFHALGARLLRIHHALIPRSRRLSIYDREDTVRLAKEVARELGVESSWEPILTDIDQLKHRGISPEEILHDPENRYPGLLQQVYRRYEERLARYDALDFTDLLLKTILLLERHPEVLDRFRHRYRHILVDEYQDTCPLQERMLNLISAPAYNLCAVGDDDQAIYAFRHADVRGILTFEERYSGAKVIRMEENYRSTAAIIHVARQVISVNRERKPKAIHTRNSLGPPVELMGFPSEEEEALWIRRKICELRSRNIPYGGIAVLCRVASLFRPLEKELAGDLIPYSLVDGLAFWERREVKDVMAYLRFIHNPLDYLSFKRIINIPPRGLGKKTVAQVEEQLATRFNASVLEILEEAGKTRPRLRTFLNLTASLRKEYPTVNGLVNAILKKVGYEDYLNKHFPDAPRRMSHLMQLLAIARRFDQNPNSGLPEFLLHAGLNATDGTGEDVGRENVRLMTIHAAKGLEFSAVFVMGLEDGILPHARCRDTIEEERRLFYVAVTRAREHLYLTWSTRRMIQGREMGHILSPFVKEIQPRGNNNGNTNDVPRSTFL